MQNIFNKQQIALAITCALTLGLSSVAFAAETPVIDRGYVIDQRQGVARSGFGLCWHSGTGPAEATPTECDPSAPVKLAQAAATPAPAAPVVMRVTLDADALFDFDKSTLRPAGYVALDEFVAKLHDMNPESIVAVGHTDRFGSERYNQRLSEQRVQSVKTYLVSKGISAERIQATGKGETEPVTKPGECNGKKSAKVIACLQPDRRVDIDVTGTRTVR